MPVSYRGGILILYTTATTKVCWVGTKEPSTRALCQKALPVHTRTRAHTRSENMHSDIQCPARAV
eukprot:147062-Pyramimonas_sp.AAC.1